MKTLSLMVAGLLGFAVSGLAAGSGGGFAGGTTGTAGGTAAAVGGGGHVASAGHVSGGSVGTAHPASLNSGSGFRSTNNLGTGGARSSFGGGAGTFNRSSGLAASPGVAVRNLPTMPTVHNAWSDPVSPRVAGTSNAAYGRNAQANYARTGPILYPGAAGYSAADRPANGNFHHGRNGNDGGRGGHRYFYNNFPYAVYYPYLYGGVGYDGLAGDYAGLTADSSVADLGAPDFSTTPNNYYTYVAPTQAAPNAGQPDTATPQQPLPDAPVVGPQNPSTAEKSPDTAQRGPDSLVEAVQDELAKRGYFAGKPDAVYSDATKEAIRRFQTDQNLPATGRINEATLHALNLD